MKRLLKTHKAKVEASGDRYFARQSNGQLWCLPESAQSKVVGGDTILITIPDPQDQFCTFIRPAPELAD
jgi:hypothetical protein